MLQLARGQIFQQLPQITFTFHKSSCCLSFCSSAASTNHFHFSQIILLLIILLLSPARPGRHATPWSPPPCIRPSTEEATSCWCISLPLPPLYLLSPEELVAASLMVRGLARRCPQETLSLSTLMFIFIFMYCMYFDICTSLVSLSCNKISTTINNYKIWMYAEFVVVGVIHSNLRTQASLPPHV